MKSISTINPAIMENAEYSIVKRVPYLSIKSACIPESCCITTLHFQQLQTPFKQRIVKEVSLLALHLPKSRTEAITCILQVVKWSAS